MLSSAWLVGFLPSLHLGMSRPCYEGVLGPPLLGVDPFAVVLAANGTTVRVACARVLQGFRPQTFRVLGWSVPDIRAAVTELPGKGVEFRRFPGMDQDELGVCTAPGAAKVAWFSDPDLDVLSLGER